MAMQIFFWVTESQLLPGFQLQISPTALKKACRVIGIKRWPYCRRASEVAVPGKEKSSRKKPRFSSRSSAITVSGNGIRNVKVFPIPSFLLLTALRALAASHSMANKGKQSCQQGHLLSESSSRPEGSAKNIKKDGFPHESPVRCSAAFDMRRYDMHNLLP
jgi:hypothetical protein